MRTMDTFHVSQSKCIGTQKGANNGAAPGRNAEHSAMKYVTGAITKYEGMESSAKTNCFQEIAQFSEGLCQRGCREKVAKTRRHVV